MGTKTSLFLLHLKILRQNILREVMKTETTIIHYKTALHQIVRCKVVLNYFCDDILLLLYNFPNYRSVFTGNADMVNPHLVI